uniref:DWNN domain-containing protein n=1 Tax=Haemonchus contortus TaxID=6289 RepID=A0A7I4XRR4_HAECO
MSSIHYKFRATLEYKTLQFDGLHITGADLKKEICLKEGIKAEAFDLLLQNAHTKRSYTAEELIPRNSSIIVQRVPREDAEKLPKIQGVNTGAVVRPSTAETGLVAPAHMNPEEFEKLSEEDQIAHIKDVSTAKYHSSNFQKKTTNIMSGPPPPTYTCNRCYQPGHWYKNCPMLATKRTTGIPSQELMETTPEDPLAMLHPSGKLVVPIMHWKARQHTKKVTEEGPAVERVPPPELTCPLCSHLLKDAVLTTCCGHSFCADCISNKLMESPDRQCPGKNCDQKQLSVDALVPNKTVRQAAQAWAMGGPGSGNQDQEHMRFRIGLQPAVAAPAASTPPPPVPAAVPQPSVAVTAPATTQPTDTIQSQNSPNPFAPAPPVSIPVPASFSQPPPNMVPGVAASSSSSGDTLLPPGTTAVPLPPMNLPLPQTLHSAANLPPIPGVGLPLQSHMIVQTASSQPSYIFNQPPPMPTMNLGAPQPQIMDAWDAFLHRKDRERERPRKRNRSRNRSSSSSSSSSSGDDRRKRRERHDRRRTHRSDKPRERDRGRDSRFRRTDERSERRDRDRERERERDYADRDRHRENRPPRSGVYQSRSRDLKEEAPLPSLMGLDLSIPPNFSAVGGEKRERSRSRSKSPQNAQAASASDRKKRKKKDRYKNDPNYRLRKPEKEQRPRKSNESEDVAREIADEEAIDGTLREVAEFVRVEANCDDDGIEFEIDETEVVVKDSVTEAEDEKSVTDTEAPPVEAADTAAVEAMSEADNEEPVERRSESDATHSTLVTRDDTTDKEKDTVAEEPAEDDEDRGSSKKKEKKHKKHKKHRKHKEGEDEGEGESKHKHKRKKDKKEKKEKRRKEKKHRHFKEKDEDTSDSRVKEEEVHEEEKPSRDVPEKKNVESVVHVEERRGSDSSTSHKRKESQRGSYSDRKHEERKSKNESNNKRYDEVRGERTEKTGRERDRSVDRRHGDKSYRKDEKSRNRSRERNEHKSRDDDSKRRDAEKDRDKESASARQRERDNDRKEIPTSKSERKEVVSSKDHQEKDRKNEKSGDRNRDQRRETSNSSSKPRATAESSSSKTQQTTSKGSSVKETVPPPKESKEVVSQVKESEEPTTAVRKQKVPITAPTEEEPVVKKLKTESASAMSPTKAALASMVKFKVNAAAAKRVPPGLKPFVPAAQETTDVEEDKSKVSTTDEDSGGDRRMRDAFSPPKLQRKKITLNL